MRSNADKMKSKTPEEEDEGEDEGQEELVEAAGAARGKLSATERTLQAKVEAFKERQVEKLLKVAQKLDDPAEALALLQQGLSQFPSLRLQGSSRVDDTLAQPAELEGISVVIYNAREEDLLPAAFTSMPTATLFQALIDERQKTASEWANLTNPALPPNDPTAKQVFGEIIDVIEQAGIIHYEIVRAGLFLHVLLCRLHEQWGALRFLASKGQLEPLLLRYNAHNPFLGIGIEEQELSGVQTISAIIANVHAYLMSAEFYALRERKSAPNASKPAAGFGAYSAQVNLVARMASGSVPEREAMKTKLGKDAKQVFQTTVRFVPVAPVVVDLAETRDPITILNDISKAVEDLVNKGMDIIYQLKQMARPIGFNIYTLQFGEATPLQDNRTMMQKMRKDIYTYILKDLRMSTTLLPIIVLKHLIVTQSFAGRYGAGPVVDSVTLDPGEEREITHETSAITKRMTEESDSWFEGKTASAKDSLEMSRQNQLTKTATDTAEFTSYLNKNRTTSTNAGVKGSYSSSFGNDLIGATKFSLDANASIAITDGTTSGSSQTSNSVREQAVTNQEGMIQNHAEEVTANRERTITKTTRQEEELSVKDKLVSKVRNPNRSSPMTILFCKLNQAYNTVTSTPGFRVVFMNGEVIEECDVASLQTNILNKYFRPDANKARQEIVDLVRASAKVPDYQGRLVDMWDESSGVPRLRKDYFALLEKQHPNAEEPEDETWRPYKKQIKGVILSTRQYTLPQCGLLKQAIVGEPVLDTYEVQVADLEIKKLKIQILAEQVPVRIANGLLKLLDKALEKEMTVTEMTSLGVLFLSPAEIVKAGTLSPILGLGMGGNDPTGLEKVKKFLMSKGVDLK